MKIPEDHLNYCVRIRFPKVDFFSAITKDDHRLHVSELRDWLDELVEWQPDMYSIHFFSQGALANIWFKEEEHAMLCKLRWV